MTPVRFDNRGGVHAVTFAYDRELVELLKLSVPGYARSWNPVRREWLIEAVYARELAADLRQLGCVVVGLDPPPHACDGWAHCLFRAVGPQRAGAVHRALSRVLHPDAATGCPTLQRELNDARAELAGRIVNALGALLADPGSATVAAALGRTCGLCKAPAGVPCRNTIRPGEPLAGRTVHFYRLLADKKGV